MVSKNRKYDKGLKAFLHRQLAGYAASIGGMSENEMDRLKGWVAAGNSVFDNPYCMSDERGNPIDYINAIRICDEMEEEAAKPKTEGPLVESGPCWEPDEDLPF